MRAGFMFGSKWVCPIRSPLHNSSARRHSYLVKGRDDTFETARVSSLTFIPEESETLYRYPLKEYALPDTLRNMENSSFIDEEIEVGTDDAPERAYDTVYNPDMHFSLLMDNIHKLEEIFVNSELQRLEREILIQIDRLGATKLFQSSLSHCLERPSNSLYNLEDCCEGKLIVWSKKKGERKSRRQRAINKAAALSVSPLKSRTICSVRKPVLPSALNPRSKRLAMAKNESEMSGWVKKVSHLERIRATLEGKDEQKVTLSKWAEAVGMDDKTLQQHLHFGWYCRDKLLKSTRCLVIYVARNYCGLGIGFDDLIQAGNIGVLQGAERFDQTRGYRFSTYVQYWIKKSMSNLVAQHSRGIRIPASLYGSINKIQKAKRTLFSKSRVYPQDDEIAKFTGLSLGTVKLARKCSRNASSINQTIKDGLNIRYTEIISDKSIKMPEEFVIKQHLRKDISNLLEGLHPREKYILLLRYGFIDEKCRSLAEIGRYLHVTKEWVRKIEKEAFKKLRKEEIQMRLNAYLEP